MDELTDNKSSSNKMAISTNTMRAPFVFDNKKEQNARCFVKEFREYAHACELEERQVRVAFKLSLTGETQRWARGLESDFTYNEIEEAFLERFTAKNVIVNAINELANAKIAKGETLLGFLDRIKEI